MGFPLCDILTSTSLNKSHLLGQLPVSKPVLKKRAKEKLKIHWDRCRANKFPPIVAVSAKYFRLIVCRISRIGIGFFFRVRLFACFFRPAQRMSGRIRHLFLLRLVRYLR